MEFRRVLFRSPAARTAGRRTLAAAGEERAGAFGRRGDDRPAQVIGAAHVSASEPASIRVLDREYTVGVEPGERDSLMTAAKLPDARMREVSGANRLAAAYRVAVLAALNLSHAPQQQRAQHQHRAPDPPTTGGQ